MKDVKKFKIGDRVRAKKRDTGNCNVFNKVGTVIMLGAKDCLVEFDEYICGHDGCGKGKDGYCWWCWDTELEQLNDLKVVFDGNKTILSSNGKEYVATCEEGDTYDKEKGLLVCIAKANGITFEDLQQMLEKAEIRGYREVKRQAEAGEYIKIVKTFYSFNKEGDILKVGRLYNDRLVMVKAEDHPQRDGVGKGEWSYSTNQYVVLENYKPSPEPQTKFNVGDLVFVKNVGSTYSTYSEWLDKYAPEIKENWADRRSPSTTDQYKVVAKGKHTAWEGMLYAIQDLNGKVFIIGEKGLK